RLPRPPLPASARNWALFLDVDGTLLDLAPSPNAVQVSPKLIDLLAQLQARLGGALALISGRSIATLDRLFEPLRLASAGLHGFERRDAAGSMHRMPIDAAALARLRPAAYALAANFPGI